ncbi:5-oxoprolinase subunit PxpB [Microbulbifer pacificus]|uniref:5-oxoprolinase subunit PxpB n=1 Tax=Microbulbifer pacificus TaxID=407164 RepID=A0AAU0N1P9_9GAMM|nr:5-oxoprolinase subunit PxpB [Microbulbifer pacificus]WOX06731.1 5-oxoprolinase subunit PxpB [Microbulbifer pacificus]
MIPPFTLRQNGDAALDICFDATPGESLSRVVISLKNTLERAVQRGDWPELRELIPAYQCLTVCYDPLAAQEPVNVSLQQRIREFVAETIVSTSFPDAADQSQGSQIVVIPVCYDAPYAPDMSAVCAHTGLSQSRVIELHCQPDYLVHMLGFTPGFLYLGGLARELQCPRKAKPELRVAAGSVGIGGAQTGIYPQSTPGGWQIIGRTPLSLFAPYREYPFIARPLDRIRFVSITSQEFEAMKQSAANTSNPVKETT